MKKNVKAILVRLTPENRKRIEEIRWLMKGYTPPYRTIDSINALMNHLIERECKRLGLED